MTVSESTAKHWLLLVPLSGMIALLTVAGLLKYLRVGDVGTDNNLFRRLLDPSLASVFTRLIANIGIRTTKEQIAHELEIPGQRRYIVPVNFSALER